MGKHVHIGSLISSLKIDNRRPQLLFMKKVGLAAFEDRSNAYNALSANLIAQDEAQLRNQLELFQSVLSRFAVDHAAEIRSSPEFRTEFARMCTAIGVDPLASSSSNKQGSFWASLLGQDMGDFYFELSVRVIEICRLTRDENGGLIPVADIRKRLADPSQPRPIDVSEDDILRSVRALGVLGKGLDLEQVGGEYGKAYIRSVPRELSTDQSSVLGVCDVLGYVSVSLLRDNLGWAPERCRKVLDEMVGEGLVWVDDQGAEREYWTPTWLDH
jgi:ESCRT-II complex subunit VPS22